MLREFPGNDTFGSMKRWIAIFLLIIATTGSFVPCCLYDDCPEEALSSPLQDQESGACSPFFACTACPGFVAITKSVQLPALLAVLEQPFFEMPAAQRQPGHSPAFWQPPRA